MSLPFRFFPRAWIFAPLCALLLLGWIDLRRAQRVEFVSGVAAEDAVVDPASPTGYAGGKRWLIIPEHNNHSYQWLQESQQMLAQDGWRVRRVDYENAPFGREVHSASPYHWWLGLMAWCDHAISGRTIALSVERAALFADPVLHVLLLLGSALLIARWFGAFPAGLASLGLVALFPLGAAFLPGVPDCFSLVQACVLFSILPLLTGAGTAALAETGPAAPGTDRRARQQRRRFFLAGVAGGCGLWVSAAEQLPVLEGIALGGILAAWVTRSGMKATAGETPGGAPWRAWALGGAVTCLLAYLVEYFPAHMDLRLRVNHPLYGLAWLGLGELLAHFSAWMHREKPFRNWRGLVACVLAALAVAALPVAMVRTGSQAFLSGDLLASRLTSLPDGVVAPSLWAWILRDGVSGGVAAACLPLLFLVPVAWLVVRRETGVGRRAALAVAAGPVLMTLVLGCLQLHWLSLLDDTLLVLLVAATAQATGRGRWLWSGLAGTVFVAGLIQLKPAPATDASTNFKFTRAEVEGLYERALAHWIADHSDAPGPVVLLPPFRTSSFCFYGSLRGLGTQNWENRDGLLATFRIVTSARPDETQALVNERGVAYIVLPSWDTDLNDIARVGLKRPEDSFIYALDHWVLFNWLRPLPYQLPAVSGFEGQSVKILAVTDETDPATERSRLVEYFVEMQQLEIARYASKVLRRYPADLGALVALAQVEKAGEDEDGFATDFAALVANLASGSDRALAWDRRVSLAVVLALGKRNDLAREQARRCLDQIDATRIRSLTTGSLYHLLVLGKVYHLDISDPKLRSLALSLLPAELRQRL
jgi:hypothetical protein